MFDFEKFPVYIKTSELIGKLQPVLKNNTVNKITKDQLYRASMSILLNIAEGAGKYGKNDKKKFYAIARGSAQECVAIILVLQIERNISQELYLSTYNDLTEISKMLSGLINMLIRQGKG